MTFLKNFNAQNNLQAILYLMGTEIFGFRPKLGPWRPFKEGTPHLVTYFGGTFFQAPITWVRMNCWGIFRAKNDCLVVGYLMGAEILESRPVAAV